MAVSTQVPYNAYTYAGSPNFVFAFRVVLPADLVVIVDGTTKTLGVDYLITSPLGLDGGGTIQFLTALTVGQKLILLRSTVLQRLVDYQRNGDFLSPTVNLDFDRLWLVLQELFVDGKRSLRAPIGEVLPDLPPAAARANTTLAFDALGNPILGAPLPVGTPVQFGVPFTQHLVTTLGATSYALPANPGLQSNIACFLGSSYQRPGIDFTWSLAAPLLLIPATAWPVGVSLDIVITQALPIGVADAGVTSFVDTVSYIGGTVGAALKARVPFVATVGALRTLPKTGTPMAYALCYATPGDGGEGIFRLDASDTTSVDNGGTVFVASDGGRWKRQLEGGAINVRHFGADRTGAVDCTVSLQAARDHIAAQATPSKVLFPAGIYQYGASPNWAIQDAEIEFEGAVHLRYTGTSNAVIVDGGASTTAVYNVRFIGKPIVEASAAALNGVFVRAAHHSKISANVRGCGAASAGMLVQFAVCSEFDFTCSINETGSWYLGARPLVGLVLDQRGAGESVSYCRFTNPILEGLPTGALLTNALGCSFLQGTMEGCSSIGLNIAAASRENKFYGTDFEVNTTHDVYCQGYGNSFYGIDSDKQVTLDTMAHLNRFYGGELQSITCLGSRNIFEVTFNRFNTTGTITDSGSYNSFERCQNPAGAYRGRVPVRQVVTVGASPFTYTNTSGDTVSLQIAGGTVSALSSARGGSGDSLAYASGGTAMVLRPGDGAVITYSVAPTVIAYL